MTGQGRRMLLAVALGATALTGLAIAAPAPAVQVDLHQGWAIYSNAQPAHLESVATPNGAEALDFYSVVVTNVGGEPTTGPTIITDHLPPGIKVSQVNREISAYPAESQNPPNQEYAGKVGERPFRELKIAQQPEFLNFHDGFPGEDLIRGGSCTTNRAATEASCTWERSVNPGVTLEMMVAIEVPAELEGKTTEGLQVTNFVSVGGGGAQSVTGTETTEVSSKPTEFGPKSFNVFDSADSGLSDTNAGDHPYESQVALWLNTQSSDIDNLSGPEANNGPGPIKGEEVRDIIVNLPPGIVGDPDAAAKCPQAQFDVEKCPPDTQIGVEDLYALFGDNEGGIAPRITPIYNIVPETDEPADFQFRPLPAFAVDVKASLTTETNYGARVVISGIERFGEITGSTLTFFGSPLTDKSVFNRNKSGPESAFLTNPVNCAAGAQKASLWVDSWSHPGKWLQNGQPELEEKRNVEEGKPDNWKSTETVVYPSLTGCELLKFEPSLTVTPDVTKVDEPTGVKVDIHIPQARNFFPGLQTPELKEAVVTLPEGMGLSPSAGDGLQGCSDKEIELKTTEEGACPAGSVLGTVRVITPLLPTPFTGHAYLGEPECDPCTSADAADGKELRLFIEVAGSGVRLKKEGRIFANPATGQLTTKFEQTPQLPFEDLELNFKGGLRAGLDTPQDCGTYATSTDLTPWSAPITPDASPVTPFDISWNGEGEACPSTPPLKPAFEAGTANSNAGQYSPLTVTFKREDGEQNLAAIQVHTPPGLLGILANVKTCPEPQASIGTCGPESEIGTMTVAAGPGAHPFYEKGYLYLTGPYKGAPFGLSIVVPTKAGPFNLGDIVVRASITVDPLTTALTVTTDPLPQVIDGIPLRLRSANVTVNRPNFIFNPTDCKSMQITGTLTGAKGAVASVAVPFAVAGCHGLPFGPHFDVYASGVNSRKDGAALLARLVYPAGPQSNISHAKVELPKQLPSRLTTLQKACPNAVFEANPSNCPIASVVGIAKATTPVLPVPLYGPAYFVSHGDEAFPNLIVLLQGYGVRIDLIGNTFISEKGITSTTFENVPDVEVTSFELFFPQGPNSALTANGNLCKEKLSLPTSFEAQDGAQLNEPASIHVTGCSKAAKARKARKARKAGKARKASRGRRAKQSRTLDWRAGR